MFEMHGNSYTHEKVHNEKISEALKGRIPWNKGKGIEHPSIRQMVETRRMNKLLRELIRDAFTC